MARALHHVRDEALQLSARDRLKLAQELQASVMTREQHETEEAWLDEAERRRESWKVGQEITKPGEEVLARLREE